MSLYQSRLEHLGKNPRKWLITGVAGFIGCNLLETLLTLDQSVVGVDNFMTGRPHNLDQIRSVVSPAQWANFHFIQGDVRDIAICRQSVKGVDYVLHEAALGSVPRSIENPILTNQCNIDGFLNMLVASRDEGVKRFVYASSSSIYGDSPELPKVENHTGRLLSPYALTKYVNELYADVFSRTYGLTGVGLRYFNIFGPHQDPEGAYAAVIPRWISAMLKGEPVLIHGDGETSRDFCYIANAVQANILAATSENPEAMNQVYNIAVGERTSLNELHALIRTELQSRLKQLQMAPPQYLDFRDGDVRHSLANIKKAKSRLGYRPTHTVGLGLRETVDWYIKGMKL